MNIRALVKTTLNDTEITGVKNLFAQTPFSAFIQNPEYEKVIGRNALHVLLYSEDLVSIMGYALVEAKKKLLTTISFGPICSDENLFPLLADSCIKALQEYGFKIIRFQPPDIQIEFWNKTLSHIQEEFTSFSLPSELNWSTLLLDITPSMEELVKSFSGNHRRNIQKAQKANLIIEKVTELGEMEAFSKGLKKMYSARGIASATNFEIESLKALFNYTKQLKNSFILKAMHGEIMIGGIVIVLHNNTAFNLMGFADPEYRKIPINYPLILRSIEIAKTFGLNVFDFGGIGRPGQADNQVLKINEFKEGFGGKKIDYPNTIVIAKNFLYKFLYTYYIQFRKIK
ncbi:MAG TPA: GNAT family N-acetyltransferase [Hanamia sp.]|nr:GNAT family N-acetyltransferase [Hanamia sp.]